MITTDMKRDACEYCRSNGVRHQSQRIRVFGAKLDYAIVLFLEDNIEAEYSWPAVLRIVQRHQSRTS